MNNIQLHAWFKDKVIGNINDTQDYLDQSVNIEVDKVVGADVYSQFVKQAAATVTDRIYSEHGHDVFDKNPDNAYMFYSRLISLSNLDKLQILHKVIGD